jgi:hypothetical protein
MTSVEYLEKEYNENKGFLGSSNFEQAKEMHKVEQEKLVDDALINYHIVDTNKTITEISDESWEGCDGCTEQDEVMYKNGYAKGYNAAIAELPKEISDEEIEIAAANLANPNADKTDNWIEGSKWYREQLKQRQ